MSDYKTKKLHRFCHFSHGREATKLWQLDFSQNQAKWPPLEMHTVHLWQIFPSAISIWLKGVWRLSEYSNLWWSLDLLLLLIMLTWGTGRESHHLLEASFKTSLIIAPIPSKISWSPASHMNAGVVTTFLAESTSASWVRAKDKENYSCILHNTTLCWYTATNRVTLRQTRHTKP